MTCKNAEIKKSCALATDLGNVEDGEENGMLIGPIQETDEYRAYTRLMVTSEKDVPGIRFRSVYEEKKGEIAGNIYTTDLVLTGKGAKMVGEVKRPSLTPGAYFEESGGIGINVVDEGTDAQGNKLAFPQPYMIDAGGSGLWIDPFSSIKCFTYKKGIVEADGLPVVLANEVYRNDENNNQGGKDG